MHCISWFWLGRLGRISANERQCLGPGSSLGHILVRGRLTQCRAPAPQAHTGRAGDSRLSWPPPSKTVATLGSALARPVPPLPRPGSVSGRHLARLSQPLASGAPHLLTMSGGNLGNLQKQFTSCQSLQISESQRPAATNIRGQGLLQAGARVCSVKTDTDCILVRGSAL